MAYSGKFRPKNVKKYKGDPTKVTYRSLWERQVLKFLDSHPSVVQYSSEEVVVPYRCKTDRKLHRYFPDMYVKMKNGKEYLIEVKPKCETIPPKPTKKKTRRSINEVLTYAKNTSKWEAAEMFCQKRGWIFQIWDEEVIQSLGIKLVSNRKKK